MKVKIITLLILMMAATTQTINAQCADSISINSASAQCNGDGTSTVTVNITVIFGNGNNSAVLTYDSGGGSVIGLVFEDDNGDIIDQTYSFDIPTCNNFSLTLTAWTNPSGNGTSCSDPVPDTENIIVNPPLPVDFGTLKVNEFKNGLEVCWFTYTEINNQYFEIERSKDGILFLPIGSINASDNSFARKEYAFYDQLPYSGINYYRIKQYDFDGNYSYSESATILFNNQLDVAIYPNPTTDYFTITSELNSFNILNNNGSVMKRIVKSGLNETVDVTQYSPGLYYVQDLEGRSPAKVIVINN